MIPLGKEFTAAALVLGGDLLDAEAGREVVSGCRPIIACDRGADRLLQMGIIPDVFVGDRDSVSDATLDFLMHQNVPHRFFPERKDWTDSELGLEFLLDLKRYADGDGSLPDDYRATAGDSDLFESLAAAVKDMNAIYLIAAFGNRPDHVFMNQLLCADRCSSELALAMTDGVSWQWFAEGPTELKLAWPNRAAARRAAEEERDWAFSTMALDGPVTGLSYHSAGTTRPSYPLDKITLDAGQSLGISNYAVDEDGSKTNPSPLKISWETGKLAVSVVPYR